MVTASYAPLLALVLARVAGASALEAANVGLVVAIVVLGLPRIAGRAGGSCAAGRCLLPARSQSYRAL